MKETCGVLSVWGCEYGVSRKQRVNAGERSRIAPPTRPNGALRIDVCGARVRPERVREGSGRVGARGGEVGLCSRWFGRGWLGGLSRKIRYGERRINRLRNTSSIRFDSTDRFVQFWWKPCRNFTRKASYSFSFPLNSLVKTLPSSLSRTVIRRIPATFLWRIN